MTLTGMTSTQIGVGALNGLGTGAGGAECYMAGNIVDTGLQQVAFNFSCAGGVGAGQCSYVYDVRTSCSSSSSSSGATTTTAVPAVSTTATTVATSTSPVQQQQQQQVCFQEYTNSSCMTMSGTKQCSAEGRCTHIDYAGGQDKSTLQTCGAGYMTLAVYKNTSSCRAPGLLYAVNTSLGPCVSMGGHWGILTCGELRGEGEWWGVLL